MTEPSAELVRAVLSGLREVCKGDILELRIAKAQGCVQVMRTDKKRFGNKKRVGT